MHRTKWIFALHTYLPLLIYIYLHVYTVLELHKLTVGAKYLLKTGCFKKCWRNMFMNLLTSPWRTIHIYWLLNSMRVCGLCALEIMVECLAACLPWWVTVFQDNCGVLINFCSVTIWTQTSLTLSNNSKFLKDQVCFEITFAFQGLPLSTAYLEWVQRTSHAFRFAELRSSATLRLEASSLSYCTLVSQSHRGPHICSFWPD